LTILKTNESEVLDFSMVKCDIGRVDIDGLRDFDKDDLSSSKFMELFSYLSVCVRTGISEETILKREYGRERGLSDLSLLSTSSDEDKAEDASERACQYFISGILDLFQSIRFLSLEKGKYGDKLAVYVHSSVQRKASKLTTVIGKLIIKP
jgi:hypothetical protein